jgi:hypothetical protein
LETGRETDGSLSGQSGSGRMISQSISPIVHISAMVILLCRSAGD